MSDSILNFNDITDFIRQLNKIKKKYPEAILIHNGQVTPELVTKLALGFIKRDTPPVDYPSVAIPLTEYEQLEDIENYLPVVFLG